MQQITLFVIMKIQKPDKFENIPQLYKSHTLNEILPFLPRSECFFDTRHWVYDTLDGILPFALTCDISRNAQQFLLLYEEDPIVKMSDRI